VLFIVVISYERKYIRPLRLCQVAMSLLMTHVRRCYNPNMDALLRKQKLGKKIRNLRMEEGKSQEDLAKVLEKSRVAVSDIERGITELSVKDLTIIAQFLNVSINELLIDTIPSVALPSFSHHRAEMGMNNEQIDKMKTAREEFRRLARLKAQEQNK